MRCEPVSCGDGLGVCSAGLVPACGVTAEMIDRIFFQRGKISDADAVHLIRSAVEQRKLTIGLRAGAMQSHRDRGFLFEQLRRLGLVDGEKALQVGELYRSSTVTSEVTREMAEEWLRAHQQLLMIFPGHVCLLTTIQFPGQFAGPCEFSALASV